MQAETAARLISLNEQFYQTFAGQFASTRQRLQPGVKRLLETFRGDENLLDLGCGSGELARTLQRRGFRGRYTGLDFSPALLETARGGLDPQTFTFQLADLARPGWEHGLTMPKTGFDSVLAFASLHHIPGQAGRQALLGSVHVLLRPGGKFIHSVWQYLSSEKLTRRIQPWSDAGLTSDQVDPGDHLLDWRAGGRGLRYVHHFDETELNVLAADTGFRVMETFRSDGENGELGLYQVWERV
jgi:tRNA (uracil-5-)-methyltransferase TRM9